MEFDKGDKVEVCSTQEGFPGSYIYSTATVVKKLDTNSHAVQYKNSVEEEDMSKLLIETVSADEVRLVPLRIKFGSGFSMFDKVDAFDNDGWWVGKVTGQRGPLYFVFSETTGDEIACHVSRLRIHLDWVNGNWVSSRKIVS
ncbi:LOW QUALITY PROTEIN: protein AGENET DOMAIN (AGD)-CONTAINING P1 [Populus alba]